MYKNTKSTSRISVEKMRASPRALLEKVYQSSWTIFVGRKIVHSDDFGEIPSESLTSLISSNKKFLAKAGYQHTDVDKLPDWFLFHPRISLIIRCLKDTAKSKPDIIPFELAPIVFQGRSQAHKQKAMFPVKINTSHGLNKEPRSTIDKFESRTNSALAIALMEALRKK